MSFLQRILRTEEEDAHTIDVAELLNREVVPLQAATSHAFLRGQVILVTGAAGSIGSELCRQLLDYEPALVIALDTNETGLFDLAEGLSTHPQRQHLQLYIGDITDRAGMDALFAHMLPAVIFHAAAYKHVPLLEQYPNQAVRTNAIATYYLCRLAQKYRVAHFIFVSTDKAANPVSIMGVTKKFGEMIIQSLAQQSGQETCFCAVRFGNVIGSRGSVVPTFMRQIEQGGPVTVTDPEATRYFMTIPEACGLTILSAAQAEAGQIYLLDMGQPIRIIDLAHKMIYLTGAQGERSRPIEIVYTGLRPGERLHEVLTASNEELTATAHGKIFCITCKDTIAASSVIAEWIALFEQCLGLEDYTLLRQHAFASVHQQMLLTVR